MADTLLEIKNLKKYFPIRKGLFSRTVGHVQAVDDVSFSIREGETLGLVGESGCGKTTTGRSLLRLIEPSDGEVRFQGKSTLGVSGQALRNLRAKMQIVFQDPYGSLNPRMTVRSLIDEGLIAHGMGKSNERLDKIIETMDSVGLDPRYRNRYPHEFSGGQRQRIGIARALALNPRFVVLDEPVSALDVSIQSKIINLLCDLREKLQLTYLFISHDLSVVNYISDRVAVMYLGEIVEMASSEELYANPLHPYTQALLSSIPTMHPERETKRIVLEGDVPSPINPPSGCRFHPRCPRAMDICKQEPPRLLQLDGDHTVTCHAVAKDLGMEPVPADTGE